MIAAFKNGHLYKVYHEWNANAKLEANYTPKQFFVQNFNVQLNDYELAKFLADYYNWITRDNLRDRLNVLEREIESLNGDHQDSAY